ncbi:hypothetical protein [Roseburia sp. 1XD42-69]|uniref:hypothetical protein n=1 Tax=Roseburia sp. 1XD42-69 TaxID=2320088 RepID=UPI000EA11A43|nr:hypothetical protein D7Y06_03760 [Roseburia sp. 1XD42-69]
MEMCYDGALVMPSSYAVMSEEEMLYLEGGRTISRSWVAVAVDVIALAICPYLAPVKFMGKCAAKALVKTYLNHLSGAFRKIVQMGIGVSINISNGMIGKLLFSNAWCLTSVGGMVSLIADYATDRKLDGRVKI